MLGKCCYGTEFYLQILVINHFLVKVFFPKFYLSHMCHFGPAKPNLGETAVLGMQVVVFFCFCLLLAMSYVNFDVYSIAFIMCLLNSVPFSIFVLN